MANEYPKTDEEKEDLAKLRAKLTVCTDEEFIDEITIICKRFARRMIEETHG